MQNPCLTSLRKAVTLLVVQDEAYLEISITTLAQSNNASSVAPLLCPIGRHRTVDTLMHRSPAPLLDSHP